MEQVAEKKLKEIFKDFNINSYILNSIVKSISLYKKQNRLEVILKVNSIVKIKDIGAFEKYLTKRFLLNDINVKIEYDENINSSFLEQWSDILDYLSYKHPLTKALLKNSELQITDSKINIKLAYTGSDILYAQKIDEILSNIIERIFDKKYKINYIDSNSEERKKNVLESSQKMQKNIILEFQSKINTQFDSDKNINVQKQENNNINQNRMQKQNENSENMVKQKEESASIQESEEITPLILGRNQNIKEPQTKVIDVSIDSGKICLEGEIINTDSRELKSGKFLFMFDLYDGTSTITCKAFIEKEKFKTVSSRIKDAKGIKLSGTAQFDPFAKELRSNCKYHSRNCRFKT